MKKILKFSASWCQPCKMLAKNLETAQLTVPVEEVDIDEKTDMSVEYKIRGVPTLVMLEDGKEVKRVSGVKSVDELKTWAN
jgi:thioredoxin 1